MKANKPFVLLSLGGALLMPAFAQSTVMVVAGDTGTALSGVEAVLYSEKPNAATGLFDVDRRVAGLDGALELKDLPAGRYSLCFPQFSDLLNPCQWSPKASLVDTSSLPKEVRLERGVIMAVRLNDPQGKAVDTWGSSMGLLRAVLSCTRGKVPLRPHFLGGGLTEFSALVPADTVFTLELGSDLLTLADADGKTLSSGGTTLSVRSPEARVPNEPQVALPNMFRRRTPPKGVTLMEVRGKR